LIVRDPLQHPEALDTQIPSTPLALHEAFTVHEDRVLLENSSALYSA
jgi:hypothetical protein